jgi:preprotein translocase subunit SecG
VIYAIIVLHIVVCIFLNLVVLLQQGKGADLSVFGGGSTQTAFGARSATTLLHKLTVTSFVLFICTTLLIGILQGGEEASVLGSEAMNERVDDMTSGDDVAEEADGAAGTNGAVEAPVQSTPAPPATQPDGPDGE